MTTQALWEKDPALMQLPHVTRDVAERCAAAGVEDVIGLIEMEDADRAKLLGMPDAKLEAVAKWCNRYPDVDLKFDIDDKDDIATGDAVTVLVQLERDFDGELPPVRHTSQRCDLKSQACAALGLFCFFRAGGFFETRKCFNPPV